MNHDLDQEKQNPCLLLKGLVADQASREENRVRWHRLMNWMALNYQPQDHPSLTSDLSTIWMDWDQITHETKFQVLGHLT
jgi:hypothetical protein